MKRLIRSVFFLLLLAGTAMAQQKAQYTQYMQNMSIINPAVTGRLHFREVRLGRRAQWLGLEGAPKTSYLTVSIPLNFGETRSGVVDYGVTEPATKEDKLDYESSMPHHGIGVLALKDETGPISKTTINLTYAYHIIVSDVANLSLGIGAGYNHLLLDINKLKFEDPNEPAALNGNNLSKWTPDLNAGVYFYSAEFYFGASVQQLLNLKTTFTSDYNDGKEVPHYFVTSGYRFWLKNNFSFTPSFMVKYLKPLPMSYDASLKIAYKNNVWMGGSFRKDDSYSLMMGFNVAKSVTLGYAFDNTLSNLQNVSSNSHEVVLGLNF